MWAFGGIFCRCCQFLFSSLGLKSYFIKLICFCDLNFKEKFYRPYLAHKKASYHWAKMLCTRMEQVHQIYFHWVNPLMNQFPWHRSQWDVFWPDRGVHLQREGAERVFGEDDRSRKRKAVRWRRKSWRERRRSFDSGSLLFFNSHFWLLF